MGCRHIYLLLLVQVVDFHLLVIVVDIMGAVKRVFDIVEHGPPAKMPGVASLHKRVSVPDSLAPTPYIVYYRTRHSSL